MTDSVFKPTDTIKSAHSTQGQDVAPEQTVVGYPKWIKSQKGSDDFGGAFSMLVWHGFEQ